MTPFHLHNKTVLITGASSGIGKQTAIDIAGMGARVVLTARNKERLTETFQDLPEGDHQMIVADILIPEDRERLIAQLPQLDGVVNSAGVVNPFPIRFISQEKIDETLNINYEAPLLLMAGITKNKKLNKNASVVFMSSISGQHPHKGGVMYSSSKAAIESLSKVFALEHYHLGIRSNCISPAMVKTEMYDEAEKGMSKESMDKHIEQYPLGVGTPQDVSHAIIFLLSDASKWITGINLRLDGGYLLEAK
ncbi:MAG: SDR family oxidoreductase [Flavobacteriales bacterium]|nr:SDR family oxidoreductase [Flavobacteriales bacterium]